MGTLCDLLGYSAEDRGGKATNAMWSNLPAPEVGGGSNDEGCDPCYPHNSPPPRADVADHRVVNHTLGDMDTMMRNPFKPGE